MHIFMQLLVNLVFYSGLDYIFSHLSTKTDIQPVVTIFVHQREIICFGFFIN